MLNIEALRQLRRVVTDAPEDLLHMRTLTEEASCGTARCAFGWASVDPWFLENTVIAKAVTGDGRMDFACAAYIFGVGYSDAAALFGAELCSTVDPHAVSKEEVIWNVNELLEGRPALPYQATESPSDEGHYAMYLED